MKDKPSYWRGHLIFNRQGEWFYSDNTPVKKEPNRTCGYCHLPDREDGHDACLGEIVGAMNACCGHGDTKTAYVQFPEKRLAGEQVLEYRKLL